MPLVLDKNLSQYELEFFMNRAIKLAAKGVGKVSPNPMVGAVLVNQKKIIITAYHGEQGAYHAELIAIQKMIKLPLYQADRAFFVQNTILFVTLEPCCHYGKTPPCTKAIIASGIKTVVIAQIDPNPLVAGKGIKELENAGITVITNILTDTAQHQIRFFRQWMINKIPFFSAKIAISQDNFYTTLPPTKCQISQLETINYTKCNRFQFDAILIGKNTLLIDNPKLELLSPKAKFYRLIVCRQADFNVDNLQLFKSANANVIVFCQKISANYNYKGLTIIYKDIFDLVNKIADLNLQSVLIESGGDILDLFINNNLLNELMLVKSTTLNLISGKLAPDIPANFKLIQTQKLVKDSIYLYG